ncbi:RNA-binding S4 domain-containing protein [Rhodospirillum sp. A1_3_36]|uniref:RNA-binding S4 domain-containing protein n=1 Tax=Rhodospirillum sp. A1_3_36 TaxID=3391666 RepID=UPI0039A574C5
MTGGESQRLDKWLWFARFCKTRSLAQKLCEGGHVKRDGQSLTKPATPVKPGDCLSVVLGPVRRTVIVQAPGLRRGPAPEAQTLYTEPEPPERLRDPVMEGGALLRPAGLGRPTKRDRRALEHFKGQD